MKNRFLFILVFFIALILVGTAFMWKTNLITDKVKSDGKVPVKSINKSFHDIYPYEKLKEKVFVPDAETALGLAKTYIGHKTLEKYTRHEIAFLENDEVWWVIFMPEEIKAGGDLNIAIQKKDGKVISTWVGE